MKETLAAVACGALLLVVVSVVWALGSGPTPDGVAPDYHELTLLTIPAEAPTDLGTMVAPLQAGPASVITVNTFDDELNADGDCSLREAVEAANTNTAVDACEAGSGSDAILVPEGWYTLSIPGAGENGNQTGDLDLMEDLILQGIGPGLTFLDGGDLDRVLHVLPGVAAEISYLVITNGRVVGDDGGGVRNDGGTLALNYSVLWANEALDGGGLANWAVGQDASATLNTSWVLSNTVTGGGGGIVNVPMEGLTATLTLFQCAVQGNVAETVGGGIWLTVSSGTPGYGSLMTLDSTTVSGNRVEGWLPGPGNGGGIAIQGATAAVLNSTVSGNEAHGYPDSEYGMGGGIWIANDTQAASLVLLNSTIANNEAGWAGGGGIGATNGSVAFKNTIVAGNVDMMGVGPNCFAWSPPVFTSLGHNLEDMNDCHLDQPTDLPNTNPLLSLLADHGGATKTHALQPGSPALQAGDDAACPPVDQRRVARPQGMASDIGSYELDSTPPQVVAFSPPHAAMDVAIEAPVIITFSEPIDTATLSGTMTPDPGGWTANWTLDDTVVSLTHTAFDYETLYTFVVSEARDRARNSLTAPVAWAFFTEPDPCVPVGTATITGPVSLSVGYAVSYTATYAPLTATQPLTLAWDNGTVGPTATYSWTLPGSYTVAVTASNTCGVAHGVLPVAVHKVARWAYLPLVIR